MEYEMNDLLIIQLLLNKTFNKIAETIQLTDNKETKISHYPFNVESIEWMHEYEPLSKDVCQILQYLGYHIERPNDVDDYFVVSWNDTKEMRIDLHPDLKHLASFYPTVDELNENVYVS